MFTTESLTDTLKPVFAPAPPPKSTAFGSMTTETLTNEHKPEILAFLAERPLHTVIMAGRIRDNGVVSISNRGTFHAYRGFDGFLEGVALVGHATLMEVRSRAALAAFARLTQDSSSVHLIMAEEEKVGIFWSSYALGGQRPRSSGRELLFEQRWPVEVCQPVMELCPATLADLEAVMSVQAEMALAESGVNPMKTDYLGFRQRCARRIELERTWVWRDDRRLIFKADIMADTPSVAYLEGVWTNPEERNKDYGLRCLTQLGRQLLSKKDSVCVFVNERNLKAHGLYRKAGYKVRSSYRTVFLHREQTA
jgi:hypothetical protein